MECNKTVFEDVNLANIRADKINSENNKTGKQRKLLRPYRCEFCGKYHLTSKTKHEYRFKNDISYRNKIREAAFIKRESEHWENYFSRKISK